MRGNSRAILRFLAQKYGYYPIDPLLAAESDMISDAHADVFEALINANFGKKIPNSNHHDKSTIPQM